MTPLSSRDLTVRLQLQVRPLRNLGFVCFFFFRFGFSRVSKNSGWLDFNGGGTQRFVVCFGIQDSGFRIQRMQASSKD
ncbi:hypothetical protein RchiOBHm_Chr5g0040051 [Rosa chinensis]|uniref:Uncharacterized protein n=1 Tax=Rosa chinensis TaxID=74649 RepID=A0A2P6QCE8_ROSCH|nr:hypothetical protein RchiOBHm_Chr5g0040051 [Rosa chinensis]